MVDQRPVDGHAGGASLRRAPEVLAGMAVVREGIRRASLAALTGLIPHYLSFYLFHTPLWTDLIAQWIMARTPSHYAVWILQTLGPWAKPFAVTGGLATLGAALFLIQIMRSRWSMAFAGLAVAAGMSLMFEYRSALGEITFWIPALLTLLDDRLLTRAVPKSAHVFNRTATVRERDHLHRREAIVMLAGTAGVALESYARNETMARRAVVPVDLFPFRQPAETFSPGLVRKAVTPIPESYGMSKNTVDPVLDPKSWRLRITVDGRPLREITYTELLAMPRVERYVTMRCISNTLKSDLMGTAYWAGVRLEQLVDHRLLPGGILEVAVIGVDGHGDSLPLDFAFSGQVLFALGMNGKTLDRTHGFPVRLLCPRFYGFKNVKWIGEIAFLSTPYLGTWPKMGYTKDPQIHTASHIDRVVLENGRLIAGGVSFAGDRGIRRVTVRADEGSWVEAELESPLSPYTWTRWRAALPVTSAKQVEARALDGTGTWQDPVEGPLFPDGVKGPTIKRLA
jgi:DMSO/TMAO reductase YedYZ molybdopterin-dependent catalytic subunit